MDLRRDVLPALLALVLSLALHAAIFGLDLSELFHRSIPEIETVVVDYLPAPQPKAVAEGPGETPPPVPESVQPPPPRPPAPKKKRVQSSRPAPEAKPAPEAPPAEKPRAPESPAQPEPPVAAPRAEPPASEPEGSVTPPARQPPRLADLMPKRDDVRTTDTDREGPPDPAGGQTREATLTLGDADIRYRGYLDGVEAAIDLSWSRRWKEALLAAGRAGSVLVRFTLIPGGEVEKVEVMKGSGSPILDDEAANAIRRAPLPPFPNHWTIERLHLLAQFDYRFE